MPFTILRNDITKLRTDAIVNAANTALQMGGGVCGAIFRAAGQAEMQAACDKLAPIWTGEAVITPGFRLPAKHVIHTAGPIWHGGQVGEEALLRACYINSLALAQRHDCESVAFPLISGGIYGYPKAEALRVATDAIRGVLRECDMDVSLVVFDRESLAVSDELLRAVAQYIDEHYVEAHTPKHRRLRADEWGEALSDEALFPSRAESGLFAGRPLRATTAASSDDRFEVLDEPFSAVLLRLIDASGKTDAEVYRRANIDRRLFSKIRSNAQYTPGKSTVLAFAIALELSIDQTKDLLERAGLALSRSRKFDVIVEYFIRNRIYDIFEINEVLFRYDQPLLGGRV